ncbi:MAG: fructose 1,6-bisphosphatase [Alteromonadaceae bacterium]|uniref:Fructose-1,6-bisphosphatase class 1 n=3 Tax=Paraglaciecola TaxID=1621534 RepID=F16PA_PSEA6|nr:MULTISPECIES: class 1 fructose-bisphosphatase [Paraglaciecola]Q15ZB4.1 RecName: Full=Fructose-1,6-bisphosphatase class 1; Short=FBPase class 1; AltName: Full=D-fructose-1,6-bisphosphate 1-phosphohydrolase class 1 [Paraglaciecola sp. T6c]MAD18281.1 fructose 1,6-bisphosphatase [Alteromonadaceae bacterium]MBB20922.1 fructose 1,6-bisphosphatase [Rickettsiales bacterium]ABG38774.1 D-fructose 1,6-bisphosphatase [Paraglaciecola sp. T6c]GAC24140.1 fructose-1,6-bisphosphatase I [Paraglaciecola mesop|tara:strand:+ start:2501 stop:3472 length:972 start_codon:yes stop_codon:yes gene_type:complete
MKRLNSQLQEDGAPMELILLLRTLLAGCKEISFRVSQGALAGVLGSTLSENVQGETQKKLDVISNQILKDILSESGYVKAISSEEEDDVVACNPNGNYLVSFDPLDGSSNTDINSLIGTIFSITHAPQWMDADDPSAFLQPGTQIVAAGYVLYGPSAMLALSTGRGTHLYTLDKTHGGFLLTQKNIQVPAQTSEFAINASNQRHWEDPVQNYIGDLIAGEDGPREKDFNMRWVAAMVGDIHRVLSRGGIFMYPFDRRNPEMPGKLRLLYEANPMAFLMEQAGGLASTGQGRILEVMPTEIHQRVPVILGSKEEVETCLSYYKA